jgi:hypothetical protein
MNTRALRRCTLLSTAKYPNGWSQFSGEIKMTNRKWAIYAVIFVLVLICSAFFFFILMRSSPSVSEEIQIFPGERYTIMRKLSLRAVHESMADKRNGKSPTRAYLHPEPYAMTRWVAYRCEVPAGAIMTIVRSAPPARDLWNRYAAYYVRLTPSPPGEVEVIVQLFRGFGDESGRLNPKFFQRVSEPIGKMPEKLTGCIGKKGVPITIP